MKKVLLTALLACSVQAATIDIYSGGDAATVTGNGAMGNSYTFNNVNGDGINLTVTAFSLLNNGTTFSDAWVGRYSPGMGVCNANEGVNCSPDSHQLDNDGSYDFLLFQFSAPVLITHVRIDPTSTDDRDVMYFLGNAAAPTDLGGLGIASLPGLGFGSAIVDASTPSSDARTVTINNGGLLYNSLLFGAPDVASDPDSYWSNYYDKWKNFDPDYFKVKLVKYDVPPPSSDIPEPASMALMGSALLGLGLVARRRAVRN